MIEKKNGYIQLPALPEELDGSLVHVLWEYAKLPEAERTATYKQYWEIANASRGKVTEDTEVYHVDPENIAGFLESIRRVVTGIFHEAIGLSQYVYEECRMIPELKRRYRLCICCTWKKRMIIRAMRSHRRENQIDY